uniref:Uncharacterized protein n=2 Tax=Viruses TaxID=10239 RepID=A0AAU8GNI4_9CAUD
MKGQTDCQSLLSPPCSSSLPPYVINNRRIPRRAQPYFCKET